MLQHQHQLIDGLGTDVIFQRFSDRTLVLITQLGKVGNLIQATIPPTTNLTPPLPEQLPPPSPAIELTNLLGTAPSEHLRTLHSLYVSQIAMLVWLVGPVSTMDTGRKDVIVGLALKKLEGGEDEQREKEKTIFRGVMRVVQDMLKQV